MSYDSAGNLTNDTYSGAGSRSYDAENRMISAQGGALSGLQYYNYNADGQRVRRKVDGVETWQVYGMDGELLAEYAASAAATSPQKEYGYRNGQLLITAANSQGCGLGYTGSKTWAATSPSLGHATGQQEGSNWAVYVGSHSPHAMVFGPYDSSFGQGHHTAQFWLMVDNNSGTDVVATIDVVTGYGSNILAQRQIRRNEFTTVNQWQVFTLEFNNPCFGLVESRVWWAGTVNMKFSQVTLSASNGSAVDIKWLVADHLGTPRMIFDKTGSLANVKRHDYLPFGEELLAGVGGRTTANGYSGDNVRQKFTGQERDSETSLDFFGTRYYAGMQGRFTGPDEPFADQEEIDPQSWNLYSYVRNNPLRFVDPLGLAHSDANGNWVGDKDGECDKGMGACWRVDKSLPLGGYWDFGGNQSPVRVEWTAHDEASFQETLRENTRLAELEGDADCECYYEMGGGRVIAQGLVRLFRGAPTSRLDRAMRARGLVRTIGVHAHHIVAQGARQASKARRILTRFGIDVNGAENGVYLQSNVHRGLHTNKYYEKVNELLTAASTKQDAIAILSYISSELQKGTFAVQNGKFPF